MKSTTKKTLLVVLGATLVTVCIFGYRRSHDYYPALLNYGLEKPLSAIFPNDSQLFFEIGNRHFRPGAEYNIRVAEKSFLRAASIQPDLLEAHYQLGRIHFINGDFDAALKEIGLVLKLDPEYRRGYYMYGLIHGYQNNFDEAIYGFKEYIRRDDFNWAGHNDLAWIYFRKGAYEEARDTAEKGLANAPTNPWLNNIYGIALMNMGDMSGSRVALEKALDSLRGMGPDDWGRAYPGNDPAIYEKGLLETKEAVEYNLSLLDKNP